MLIIDLTKMGINQEPGSASLGKIRCRANQKPHGRSLVCL